MTTDQQHKASSLRDHEIFTIACGDELGFKTNSSVSLLYSPFTQSMSLATSKEIDKYNELLVEGGDIPEDLQQLIPNKTIADRALVIDKIEDIQKLSILPTNKCNFKCSYCYSREGRDSTIVSDEALDRTLEFFIDPNRLKSRNLTISYLGGGEPFMCWDTFKHSLEYSTELAEKYGFTLMNSVNTNGSIVSDDILESLIKYDVTVCITFEIFEEIQNAQRGQWAKVRESLLMMLEKGVRVIISSIITPQNVDLLPDLMKEVVKSYPQVRTVVFEPVVDMASKSFDSHDEVRAFYQTYTKRFFEAQETAEANNVRLLNSVIRKLWVNHIRFCDGEISLTPQGRISGCTSVSSPREELFPKYCYGDANKPIIEFDRERFNLLLNTNVYSYAKCEDCFLKWHCCGGCQFRNELYSDEQMDVVCDFNRYFATKYLLQILAFNNELETGEKLEDVLKNVE